VREVGSTSYAALSAQGVQEQRVNVMADLVVPPQQLADGVRVRASITLSNKANVLKVPATAVVPNGQSFAVFALVGNQARRIDILPGLRSATEVEVVYGLEQDAVVINNPPQSLKDGSRVVARRSSN
jgi:HlyD family secretion protein